MSEDFKEKLKAYTEGRLSEEEKLVMEKELDKLELYQEFLDEQAYINSSKQPNINEYMIKDQDKIIKKSKWKAKLQIALISLSIFCFLLTFLLGTIRTLTVKYYNLGNPNKVTLYINAIRAAIETTIPNAVIRGSTFKAGTFFSSDIGVEYSKKVGDEEIKQDRLTMKFHFNKPSIIINLPLQQPVFYGYSENSELNDGENTLTNLEGTPWNRLVKLPEGTVAEAYITFNKLYETDEVLQIFKNKNLKLLWLAVYTGVLEQPNTYYIGFPHKNDFRQMRKNLPWPIETIALYENGKLRNEYFIKTLEYLNEYKAIAREIDSMPDYKAALDYVNKNGVKIFGVTITGPTKEILKLKDKGLVKNITVGEARLWNWD
jgi:hypothetical protein